MLPRFSPLRRAFVAFVGAGVLLASPMHPAKAYGFVGFGFGFPVFAPFVPFYPFYGPQVIVAQSPVIYTQPPPYNPAPTGRCYAGAYVCPIQRPATVGSPCSCPTNRARAPGRVD